MVIISALFKLKQFISQRLLLAYSPLLASCTARIRL